MFVRLIWADQYSQAARTWFYGPAGNLALKIPLIPPDKFKTTYFCISSLEAPDGSRLHVNIVFHSTRWNPPVIVWLYFSLIFIYKFNYVTVDQMTLTVFEPAFPLSFPGLFPESFGAAIPGSCGSIYKSFAQCLLTLGDSLGDTEKDQNTQDIDTICRWDFADPIQYSLIH